jgi:aminoglycoside phosphotransferase (APT) family kinase protein
MFAQEIDLSMLEARLAGWLRGRVSGAKEVLVSGLKRASAGFSNETFFFEAAWKGREGDKQETMVLRRQPHDVTLFPDYDLGKQFRIMECLRKTDVPVPQMYWFEGDTGVLGSPFYLMSKIDGEIAPEIPPYHSFGLFYDATPERRRKLCLNGLEATARVHALDWEGLGLSFLGVPRPGTTDTIDRELDYYENFLNWAREEPQPILQAGLDYLRENKFPSKRTTLCWGDCRMGNMIFDHNDEVAGVLDWEMAYLGNPEADLGWFLFMDWQHSVGYGIPRLDGFPSPEEVTAHWEKLTGWKVENIFYHEVLAAFKFGVLMVKVVKNMKANNAPILADMDTNNAATQRLAALLELPPPGAQRQSTDINEITAVIQTHLTGPGGYSWYLVSERGRGTRHEGTAADPEAATTMSLETWQKIQSGELNRVEAFMGGLIQVEGDMTLLMQLEDTLNRFAGPPPQN